MSELDDLAAAVRGEQSQARTPVRKLRRPVSQKHVVAPWKIWGGAILGGMVALWACRDMVNKSREVHTVVVQPAAAKPQSIFDQPVYHRPTSVFDQTLHPEDVQRDADWGFKTGNDPQGSAAPSSGFNGGTGGGGKTVHVGGYIRKDGTVVQPYDRRAPRR